jgi:glutamate-ammonia-ligase adenylyltransferase
MYFASDLDVVFILPDKLKQTYPAVEKKIPEIQKSLLDENGNQILMMDLKLRPEGKSAPLLMTESEYDTYLEKRLSIWEVMAMTRFRNIIPSSEQVPSGKIESRIAATLKNFKLTRASVEEIVAIYNKVIQSKKYFDEIDVKSSNGGMFAIELLVQTLSLDNSQKMTDVFPGKIIDLIEKLKNISVLPDETASEVRDAYEFYRTIEFANYVSLSKANHKIPHDEHELSSLSLHLDFKNPAEFSDSLKSRMRRIGSLFRKVIADLAGQKG